MEHDKNTEKIIFEEEMKKIENMTSKEKIEHAKLCTQFVENYNRCAKEAMENDNKDLVIEYLNLKCEKTMELANTFLELFMERQSVDLKALLKLWPDNDVFKS